MRGLALGAVQFLALMTVCSSARLMPDEPQVAAVSSALAAERSSAAAAEAASPVPLIGILSQPLFHPVPNVSYIAASYAQMVEAAGARAVPILFTDPPEEIERRFNAISGLILPGGTVGGDATAQKTFEGVARGLVDRALAENRAGRPFAVHGVCMGFQMLMKFTAANDSAVLSTGFDSKLHPNELRFSPAADMSRLLGGGEDAAVLRARMAVAPPVILENHVEGVTPATFHADALLSKTWEIISTSFDRNGREYVSTVEASDPGVYFSGTQWHPEKNAFEFKAAAIPHGADAVRVTQHVANKLVDAARMSPHRLEAPPGAGDELSIWNTPPAFRSPLVKDFQLIFLYGPGVGGDVEDSGRPRAAES